MFIRAQLSSQIATISDFLFTISLVELFKNIHYIYANLAGAICGGIINCIINYKWTFKSKCKKRHVFIKYIFVWIGSIILNIWGIYVFTELLKETLWVQETLSQYMNNIFIIPKIIVSILVAFIWNYNMQRYFVYRNYDIKGSLKKQGIEIK